MSVVLKVQIQSASDLPVYLRASSVVLKGFFAASEAELKASVVEDARTKSATRNVAWFGAEHRISMLLSSDLRDHLMSDCLTFQLWGREVDDEHEIEMAACHGELRHAQP
eukprot:2898567-Rhodomonas_salina.1